MRHKRTLSQLIAGIKNYVMDYSARFAWSLMVHQITGPGRHFTVGKFENRNTQLLGPENEYWNDSETRRQHTAD